MAENVDETVIKISAQIDPEDIKNIRGQLKDLQQQGGKNAINLGISGTGGAGTSSASGSNEILNKSRKDLDELLKIAKKEDIQKTRLTDKALSNSEGNGTLNPKKPKGPTTGEAIGGHLEQVAGALTSAAGAAALAGPVAAGIAALALAVKGTFDKATSIYEKRLQEDFQLAKIQQQLGKSPNEAFAFSQRAKLAGGDPDSLRQSDESQTDELLRGINPIKAQLLAHAGIDIQKLFSNSKGDPEKLRQSIFVEFRKMTSKLAPAIQGGLLRELGYSSDEQITRQNLNNHGVVAKANELTKSATRGTKNGQLNDLTKTVLENIDFKGIVLATEAAQRAFSQTAAGKSAALSSVKIDANIANITANGAINISKGLNENISDLHKQAQDQYGLTDIYNAIKNIGKPQNNPTSTPNAPASLSGSYSSTNSR